MAEFKQVVITKKGQALIAKLMSGSGTVEFTSIAVADGQYKDDQLEGLTNLTGIRQSTKVSKVTPSNDVAITVEGAVSNQDLKAGYNMNILGLYAKDPNEGEILFAVSNANVSGYMPPFNGKTTSGAFFKLTVTVGNASNIQLQVDPSAVATIGDITALEAEITDLKNVIGYNESDVYGVEADFKNSVYTRLAGAKDRTPGQSFDKLIPWQRKRCILADDGTVLAYYGEQGYSETGFTTAPLAINGIQYPEGTPAQVMVEQPRFYYKVTPLVTERIEDRGRKGSHLRKARYYISATPHAGFKIHPAFVQNGVEKNYIYLSAFEACGFNSTEKKYNLTDEQTIDFEKDTLSSIAGAKPATGLTQSLTRENARKIAQKRGAGWQLSLIQSVAATQLLFLIEYGNFDSTKEIGAGISTKVDDGTTAMTELTGATSTLGNKSGSHETGTGYSAITYRGEENFWGNCWTFIDGANSRGTKGICQMWVADHNYTDQKTDGDYAEVNFNYWGPVTNGGGGYISAFGYDHNFDWLFLPTEVSGSSAKPVGDYFWANSDFGWSTFGLGGRWSSSVGSGVFCLALNGALGARHRSYGSRLVFLPAN